MSSQSDKFNYKNRQRENRSDSRAVSGMSNKAVVIKGPIINGFDVTPTTVQLASAVVDPFLPHQSCRLLLHGERQRMHSCIHLAGISTHIRPHTLMSLHLHTNTKKEKKKTFTHRSSRRSIAHRQGKVKCRFALERLNLCWCEEPSITFFYATFCMSVQYQEIQLGPPHPLMLSLMRGVNILHSYWKQVVNIIYHICRPPARTHTDTHIQTHKIFGQ